MSDTYRVSTWDHDIDDWSPDYTGLTKWQLRDALRQLYYSGFTQASIQVHAETHDRPAARFDRENGFCASTVSPRCVINMRKRREAKRPAIQKELFA